MSQATKIEPSDREGEIMAMLSDYRNAASGTGALAFDWRDKPHRLLYDLCNDIEYLLTQTAALRAESERIREQMTTTGSPVRPRDYMY